VTAQCGSAMVLCRLSTKHHKCTALIGLEICIRGMTEIEWYEILYEGTEAKLPETE